MYIKVKRLKKSYGEGGSYTEVLRGFNTTIERGEMCTILGPSGSGKSTLLNIIGGLETVDSGTIVVEQEEIGKFLMPIWQMRQSSLKIIRWGR